MTPVEERANRLDAIAPLWTAGKPSTAIAVELGLTKGTVCRLVFEARVKGDPRFPARQPAVVRSNQRRRPAGGFVLTQDTPERPREQVGRVELMDLRAGECRYPTLSGTARGEHLFCGAPKDLRSEAYCKTHHRVCCAPLGVRLGQFAKGPAA